MSSEIVTANGEQVSSVAVIAKIVEELNSFANELKDVTDKLNH